MLAGAGVEVASALGGVVSTVWVLIRSGSQNTTKTATKTKASNIGKTQRGVLLLVLSVAAGCAGGDALITSNLAGLICSLLVVIHLLQSQLILFSRIIGGVAGSFQLTNFGAVDFCQ